MNREELEAKRDLILARQKKLAEESQARENRQRLREEQGKDREFTLGRGQDYLQTAKGSMDALSEILPRAGSFITSLGGIAPNPVSEAFSGDTYIPYTDIPFGTEAVEKANVQGLLDYYDQGGNPFSFAGLTGYINPLTTALPLKLLKFAKPTTTTGKAFQIGAVEGLLEPTTGMSEDENFALRKAKQAVEGGATAGILDVPFSLVAPKVRKEIFELKEKGITDFTPAQLFGGDAERLEQKVASFLPFGSGFITDATENLKKDYAYSVRNSVIDTLNSNKQIPEALVEAVPDDIPARQQQEYIAEQISNAFEQIANNTSFNANDIESISSKAIAVFDEATSVLSPEKTKYLEKLIDKQVLDKMGDNAVDGKTIKIMQEKLGSTGSSLVRSADPESREIGLALLQVRRNIIDQLKMANPEMANSITNANKAYQTKLELDIASQKADGDFTPNDHVSAIKRLDRTKNKTAFGQGKASVNQPLAEAANVVAKQKIADAGTAGNLFPILATGTLLSGAVPTEAAISLGTGLLGTAAGYSPVGRRLFTEGMTAFRTPREKLMPVREALPYTAPAIKDVAREEDFFYEYAP